MTRTWDPPELDLPDDAAYDAFRWAREHARLGDTVRPGRTPPHTPPRNSQNPRTGNKTTDTDSPGAAGTGEQVTVEQPHQPQEASRA